MRNPFKDFSHINPQPNTHFRRIEYSVFRALIYAGFPSIEYQLILCVIDRTWGYQKTEAKIALSIFHEATGGEDEGLIHRSLKDLEGRRVLIIEHARGRGKINTYMFNKHWDTWRAPHEMDNLTPSQILEPIPDATSDNIGEMVTPGQSLATIPDVPSGNMEYLTPGQSLATIPDKESDISQVGKADVPSGIAAGKPDEIEGKPDTHVQGKPDATSDTKESIKDNILKKEEYIKKSPCTQQPSDKGLEMATLLKTLILQNNPHAKTPADATRWALDFDRMMKMDRRTPEEITRIIRFSQSDSFWHANILSAGKLREKFDQLYLKAREKEKHAAEEKERGASYGTRQSGAGERGLGTHRPGAATADRFGGFTVTSGRGDDAKQRDQERDL